MLGKSHEWNAPRSSHNWSLSDFLSISFFVKQKKFSSWNVEKKATSTVLYSFKDFFAPSRDCFQLFFSSKNTTNLQVIQKQYISPVWCLIKLLLQHNWKFLSPACHCRGFICNCIELYFATRKVHCGWSFQSSTLETPLTDFCWLSCLSSEITSDR